jgi:hypothetical protein
MASVKLNEKKLLEKLQAKITLKLGKKLTQQELLDKCVKYVYNRVEEFISEELNQPKLTKEKIRKIRKNSIDAPLSYPKKSEDKLIYGI